MHGIGRCRGRRRDLGQQLTVRSAEAELAVGLSIELIAFFMDGAMVPATEQGEIRECGGASIGPVTDVMTLAEANPTARKATAAVPVLERSS